MPTWAAESQSDSDLSDTSQPFEPCEAYETFYEVVEIAGETKDKYKVCWKGNDPKTRKPWPQSWVPKGDCPDDLVLTWKSKKIDCNSTFSKRASSPVSSTAKLNSPPVDARPKSTKRKRKLDDPPKTKKRTTSDSDGLAREPCTHGERSHDVRNGGGLKPLISANEEEDEPTQGQSFTYDEYERILEEALSEGYHSVGMNDVNDESWNDDFEVDFWNGNLNDETQQMKDEQKAQEEEEDSDEVEVLKLSTTRHLPQAEEDSSSEIEVLKMAPRQPRPPNPSPRIHASPLKKPIARTVPQSPPSWKRKQPVVTARVPTLGPKALNKTRPTVITNQFKDSSFVAQSSSRNLLPRPPLFELESDSDRFPRPEWHRKPQSRPTMKHLRKERDVISIHSDECDSEVILSPRARQRLAIFDAEVMRNMDVVPGTELKNSQDGKLPPSAAIKSNGKRNNASPIASPIPGPSVPLQALPRLSSSTIHPRLPPNLSLPDTIVEPSSSLEPSPGIGAIEQCEYPENEHTLIPKSGVESGRLTTKKITLQEVFARAESRRRSERHVNQSDENDDKNNNHHYPHPQKI